MSNRSYHSESKANGFTLVEVLIAISLALVSVLALGWSLEEMRKTRTSAELISAISAIEGSLTDELMNESRYADTTIKQALQSVTNPIPANLTFQISGTSMGKSFNFPMTPGGTVSLRGSDFVQCADYPSATCNFRIQLAMQPNLNNRWAYAYRIEASNPSLGKRLNYQAMGAKATANGAFAPTDFNLVIPDEFIIDSLLLRCPMSPGGPFPLAINGINQELNLVSCIYDPAFPCADGTLPKGIRYNLATRSINFECVATRVVSCPPKYALKDIHSKVLDPDVATPPQPMCVYRFARQGTGASQEGFPSVSGQVCPEDYLAASTCGVTGDPVPGQCPDYPVYRDEPVLDIVTGLPTGATTPVFDHMETPPPNQPATGSALISNFGRNSTCTYQDPGPQQCGAAFNNPRVILTPVCNFDSANVPEVLPATF